MASIISQIAEWGTTLPRWEQYALEKILAGDSIDDRAYNELLNILLEDNALAPENHRPDPCLDAYIARNDDNNHEKPILREISNLVNVNALVSNQKLEFGDKVTVIFGDNGSGKSGYVRVIASAAFTRGDKDVLQNIKEPFADTNSKSAEIRLLIGNKLVDIHHVVGQPCQEMKSFYVFDSTSVWAHLTKSNAMSFSPANLDILTRLANITDEVRKRLDQKILSMRKPGIPMALFEGESAVKATIQGLSWQSKLEDIKSLGTLDEHELERISKIDKKIAELKSTDFAYKISSIDQSIKDITALAESLDGIGNKLSDLTVEMLQTKIRDWQEKSLIAEQLDINSFKAKGVSQVGTTLWYSFIKAAQKLAEKEAADAEYPLQDSICLLCHQPLSASSHEHIHKLWDLLLNDTQQKLSGLESELTQYYQMLTALDTAFFNEQTVSYRTLKNEVLPVVEVLETYLKACNRRKKTLIDDISEKKISEVPVLPTSGISVLWNFLGALDARQKQVEKEKNGVEQEIEILKAEVTLLGHRTVLASILDDVIAFVEAEKWIHRASSSKIKGSTKHITQKYNTLFSELVTDRYLELFKNTLERLNCPLDVQVIVKAEKGRTYKQLALKTNERYTPEQVHPDQVLSEGEQRAVALADFFTEITLDEQSAGFVLDDPVTSLDFRWKELIANVIIKESNNKQAIIFTHDLHFLHCLKTKADEEVVSIRAHWIEKRDGLPGYVFIDNSPMSEKEYKTSKIAKDYLTKAKAADVSANDQQYFLEAGFAALRTSYEAFIMLDLFNGVILRFEERISGDRLKKIYVDETIRDDVAESIGRISRYIGAHLHSDIHAAQKPTPDMLSEEIIRFDQLRQKHKEVKKKHGIID